MRKPPPLSLSDFFGFINFKNPSPESLSLSKITTMNFINNFEEFKEMLIKEIRVKEIEIRQLEDQFDQNPPYILESFNQNIDSNKKVIKDYFQLHTELYRSMSTLWINKKILALEDSYSRNNIILETNTILGLKKSATTVKDNRLEKYSKLESLQEQLEKSKSLNHQIDCQDKYLNLKSHLSFSVVKIRQGQGTIKLADYLINQKPFIPKNRYEGHCRIAFSYRCKELNYEVSEISNFFPFVKMCDLNLTITVIRQENPELHFDVFFPIQHSYPWCKIEAKTNVLIGDSTEIDSEIREICENNPFTRRPILEICKKIAHTFLD